MDQDEANERSLNAAGKWLGPNLHAHARASPLSSPPSTTRANSESAKNIQPARSSQEFLQQIDTLWAILFVWRGARLFNAAVPASVSSQCQDQDDDEEEPHPRATASEVPRETRPKTCKAAARHLRIPVTMRAR